MRNSETRQQTILHRDGYDYIIHFDSDVIFRKESISLLTDKIEEGYDLIGPRRCYKNNLNGMSNLSDLKDVYYDILAFFSPSGIKSLFQNFPDFVQNNTRIAVFGNSTVKAATEAGLKCNIEAPTPETPSMTMALEKYILEVNRK